MKVSQLKPNPNNPRLIKDHKFKQLVQSIQDFPEMMEKRPMVCVTDTDGKLYPLGGNMRLRAIQEIGMKDIPDEWVVLADEWTEEKRREFVIKDNVGFGEWEWEQLANEWDAEQLADWGLDVPEWEPEQLEAQEDDYEMPDEVQTDIVLGDLFEIGEHRLLCGDSTDSDQVAKLMNGEKANLCFTSPPYWVGKDYEYQNSEKEIDEFITAISNVICLNIDVSYSRIVINTGTASINRIDKKRKVEILPLIDKWQKSLKQHGWLMRHLRIWAKRGQLPASISPKTDVIDQHNEYIAEFENEYCQIPTFWNQAGEQRGQEKIGTKWAQQGLWDDIHGQKSAGGKHVAAFPVEIPARNILLYTKKMELLYEPFTGSGTTMVAAHQLNRKCYGMELDEKYCQVIIDRMLKLDPTIEIKRNGKPYKISS